MPQSLSNVAMHLVFSTKNRARALAYSALREKLEKYMAGILQNMGCPPIVIAVQPEHVHALFLQSRTESIASVVQTVKQSSSNWIKDQMSEVKDPFLTKFSWQKGYSVFSVSESVKAQVLGYIEGQEEHHQRMSFQEEYITFLRKHNVAYDDRYVWD